MHPNDGRVVSNFVLQALRNEPITVYGTGNQTRSFCYVDDMIDAFVRFMNMPEAFTGPMNLGNPHEVSMLELADRIILLTKSASVVAFAPLPEDDPRQRCPNIDLAHEHLQWAPTVALDDGLMETIEYFRALA